MVRAIVVSLIFLPQFLPAQPPELPFRGFMHGIDYPMLPAISDNRVTKLTLVDYATWRAEDSTVQKGQAFTIRKHKKEWAVFEYDSQGRMVEGSHINLPGGEIPANEHWTITYGPHGPTLQTYSWVGHDDGVRTVHDSVVWHYDAQGRCISRVRHDGSWRDDEKRVVHYIHRQDYQYDAQGRRCRQLKYRRTRLEDQDQVTQRLIFRDSLHYDARGRLTLTKTWQGDPNSARWGKKDWRDTDLYSYDALGRLIEIVDVEDTFRYFGNAYTYDTDGRLVRDVLTNYRDRNNGQDVTEYFWLPDGLPDRIRRRGPYGLRFDLKCVYEFRK